MSHLPASLSLLAEAATSATAAQAALMALLGRMLTGHVRRSQPAAYLTAAPATPPPRRTRADVVLAA